jgi:hypothetical protein
MTGIRILWYALVIGGILLSSKGLLRARAGAPRREWAGNVGIGVCAFIIGTAQIVALAGNLGFAVHMVALAIAALGLALSRQRVPETPA